MCSLCFTLQRTEQLCMGSFLNPLFRGGMPFSLVIIIALSRVSRITESNQPLKTSISRGILDSITRRPIEGSVYAIDKIDRVVIINEGSIKKLDNEVANKPRVELFSIMYCDEVAILNSIPTYLMGGYTNEK